MQPETDVEARLLSLIARLNGRLPDDDLANATELVSNREWGVGLELLCDQIVEYEVPLCSVELEELNQIAASINLDVSSFELKGAG